MGEVETVRGLVLGTVEPSAALGRDLRQLYDAEVAANDASFGRLLDRLEELGELDNTVIVFTSDHGEAFGEHDSWTHGLDLYNEVLSVPLVMRLPGGAGAGRSSAHRSSTSTSCRRFLDLCGIEAPVELPGAVLLDVSGAVAGQGGSDDLRLPRLLGKERAPTALRDGWKLIEPLSADFGSSDRALSPRRGSDRGARSRGLVTGPVGLAVGPVADRAERRGRQPDHRGRRRNPGATRGSRIYALAGDMH